MSRGLRHFKSDFKLSWREEMMNEFLFFLNYYYWVKQLFKLRDQEKCDLMSEMNKVFKGCSCDLVPHLHIRVKMS